MTTIPVISFIIPCFNSKNNIDVCINSILGQSALHNYEIIIIDDGSDNHTKHIIDKYKDCENITIKTHSKNRGRANTRNTGIQNANGDILVFLDSDMELSGGWVLKIREIFSNKNIVGVMGQYTYPPNMSFNKLDYYLYSLIRGPQKKYNNGDVIPFKYFLFSNTAIRKKVFNELVGFDRTFTTYGGEDTELAIRLYNLYPKGLYYYPSLISYHHGQKELKEYCNNQMVYGKVNLHKLIKKYPQYAYHLGGNWLRSWYGYLIFNDYIIKLIDYLLINNNAKILIKYKIVYSVVKGYRLGLKKEG